MERSCIFPRSEMPTWKQDPISKYLPEFAHLHVLRNPDGDVNDTSWSTVNLQFRTCCRDMVEALGAFAPRFRSPYVTRYHPCCPRVASRASAITKSTSLLLRSACTPSDYRRISRWEHEAVLEQMQARLDRMPEAGILRRRTGYRAAQSASSTRWKDRGSCMRSASATGLHFRIHRLRSAIRPL